MVLDILKKTRSWHLFEYANQSIGVFRRCERAISNVSSSGLDVWNGELLHFLQIFGQPHRQLWELNFADICCVWDVSSGENRFVEIARRGKTVYSISTQGGEVVRTSPPVCYACSSAISFIFWGTVRMGFFDKYAEEDRDFVCRKHEILVEEFLETEGLAKRCNNDIWAQIEEIPSFW